MKLSEKWYIIINPNAGNGSLKSKTPQLFNLLDSKLIVYDYIFTKFRGHAIQLSSDAIILGYRKIMAVGGDGTNHEVINGIILQDRIPSLEVQFHSIPAGTGNDWIRHHALPLSWNKSIDRVIKGNTMEQDIGVVLFYSGDKEKKRYFYNVAGMAYDAFVVNELEQKGKKSNSIAYLISMFFYLFKYKLNNVRIGFCGKIIYDKVYSINVGICKFSGGGMSLVPHAIHNDGLLALTIAKQLIKISILFNTYRFYNQTILNHSKIDGYKTDEIYIKSTDEQELLLELDGELVGKGPIKFAVLPNALKFIV